MHSDIGTWAGNGIVYLARPHEAALLGKEFNFNVGRYPSSASAGVIWEITDEVIVAIDAFMSAKGAISALKRVICEIKTQERKRRLRPVGGPAIYPDPAEPYGTLLRVSSGDALDRKAVSKYSRALRFAARQKDDQSLKKFIQVRGGINACASARVGQPKR